MSSCVIVSLYLLDLKAESNMLSGRVLYLLDLKAESNGIERPTRHCSVLYLLDLKAESNKRQY